MTLTTATTLTLLLTLLAPGAALAGAIRGFVRTPGGQPLVQARVTLMSPDTVEFRERRTDPAGRFIFGSIAPGSWILGASKRGTAYAETLLALGGSDLDVDFTLGPDPHLGRWSVIGTTDPENLYATNSGSLLPDGRILYCHNTKDPVIFDPVTGTKSFPVSSPSQQGCHVTSLLEDGRLIFIGGQGSDDFRDAIRTVKTFNGTSGEWLVLPDLIEERWYPGLARLADGRLLVMGGGQSPNAQRTPTCEIYDPSLTQWSPAAPMSLASDYPPAVLLYSGKVLRSWWPPQLYDVTANTWQDTGAMVQSDRLWPGHCDHSLVLLPDGRACAVGVERGSLTSPTMIERYDPGSGTWSLGANASATRSRPEVVMLPTGQIFVAGGKLEDPNPAIPTNAFGQVKLTDLYDPVADLWRRCADMKWFREYHATTVLVPDGRVVTAAGTGGPAQPGVSNEVEAFEPYYLFRGVRPRINAIARTQLHHGSPVTLQVSRTDSVTSIVLMGTDAVTHWVNGGVPRVLSLPFEQSGGLVTATVPTDPNRALVGHYILFAMVDDIPSSGVIVHVGPPAAGLPEDAPPRSLVARGSPNPFSNRVLIEWYRPRSGPTGLALFDVQGRRIGRIPASGTREGWQQSAWDGRDSSGREVPAGVYCVKVEGQSDVVVTKIVRLR